MNSIVRVTRCLTGAMHSLLFSFILHNVCIWGQRSDAVVASQQKGPGFKPSSGWSLVLECACSLEVLGLPPMRLGSF